MNLQKYIDEKYISVQKHPTEDLYIYNYTQKAQFDKLWTEETLFCRGLIMDSNGNVVARPFSKFFNYGEYAGEIPNTDFEVTEKLDGSLGIMYWIGKTPYIATRGSFTSDQAIEATKILQGYSAYFEELYSKRHLTYLFEIIYPENRIVVDYRGRRDLILLAVIDTATGHELDRYEECYGFPVVSTKSGVNDISKLKELEEDNKEGFVIRYANNLRLKVKFDEYVRLHRLITECSSLVIWDLLRNKKPLDELLDKVPDEFYGWVRSTVHSLELDYKMVYRIASMYLETENIKNMPSRKDQAIKIMSDPKYRKYTGIMFKILDGKSYEDAIWKLIRPVHQLPFKKEI
jgi:RNA ligase